MGCISSDIDWWNETIKPDSISFWRENRHRLKWRDISKMKGLTVDFIREFQNELDWTILNRNNSLDEKTLEEFWDKFDWKDILTRRDFSEDFLRRHKYDLDWGLVSYFQGELSEEFVEEMKDYIVWDQFNPYRSTWDKYSSKFKVKHFKQMSEYFKGNKFWGERIALVVENGRERLVKIQAHLDGRFEKEYL